MYDATYHKQQLFYQEKALMIYYPLLSYTQETLPLPYKLTLAPEYFFLW